MIAPKYPYGAARKAKERAALAKPALPRKPGAKLADDWSANVIAELDAVSRTRALTEEESLRLERAIWRENRRQP